MNWVRSARSLENFFRKVLISFVGEENYQINTVYDVDFADKLDRHTAVE